MLDKKKNKKKNILIVNYKRLQNDPGLKLLQALKIL